MYCLHCIYNEIVLISFICNKTGLTYKIVFGEMETMTNELCPRCHDNTMNINTQEQYQTFKNPFIKQLNFYR